ncbi:dihydrofolate reductase [Candidatus Parcubacteria bacterium]|nr:MAG: dihydrofolate reductase [Candidatus Parcubacteria bacterium]
MIALVAAVAQNGVIGAKNDLPWYLPEDLKRFRTLTKGKTVLMGRKTFESILKRNGKPLPDRTNVVITRHADYEVAPGVLHFTSIEEAFKSLEGKDVYVIGGGEVFKQTIDKADVLYITHVEKDVEGDVFFPEIKNGDWATAEEELHEGFRFTTYKRRN